MAAPDTRLSSDEVFLMERGWVCRGGWWFHVGRGDGAFSVVRAVERERRLAAPR